MMGAMPLPNGGSDLQGLRKLKIIKPLPELKLSGGNICHNPYL
jgi:hypothetical protein